jgi:flagellar export protein FliJ
MAVSRGLKRLLEVRALEEELSQAALEEALGDLRLLEEALEMALERERGGRRHVTASAASADAADRIAGLEETRAASRRVAALRPRIAEMEAEVTARRAAFLSKRMERQQVETLIRKTEAVAAQVAARRAQREIDDWFLRGAERARGAVEKS